MSASEPPRPQRGLTADERGSDASAPERDAAAATSMPQRVAAMAKPAFLLSQADGYPMGIKQFLQLCLILIYPGWLFALLVMWAIYGVFWALFAPLRLWMKRRHPADYAASQRK